MKETERDKISTLKGAPPIKSCPSGHWSMSRPRFYWMRKPVETGKGTRLVADTNYYVMEFLGEPLSIQPFLGQKYRVHENFKTFPTFVQSRARKSPPILPAGINGMDSAALQRWRADDHRFAPYQYAIVKLVQDKKNGDWSPPSTRTREALLGFRPGHTEAAAIARGLKVDDRKSMHLRDTLLGQSIHCGTLALLMASPLHAWDLLPELPSLDDVDLSNLKATRDEGRPSEARRLARMYASYSTHRGNEIRLESGPRRTLQRPSWQQLDARQWNWRTVISCQWEIEGDSMPALETRAVLLTLQWRARSVARLKRKFIHLSDSQSALGCLTKHRSGACSLNYLVERSTAIQLASFMEPIFAFVRTHINPADKPSRHKIPVRKMLTLTQRSSGDACRHSAAPQASVLLCSVERCLALAPYQCDNCAEWVCKRLCHAHTRAYTFCVACQGHQVKQRLGTPLQPGPLVKQRLGTPLPPTPANPPSLPAKSSQQQEGDHH